MKNKKAKKVRRSGRLSFWLFNIMLSAIILGAVSLSLFGKVDAMLPLDDDYRNVIGVSTQVITAIISFVVSIIGIAISLQNEDYFGVKVTKLYALRVKKHYSILSIILISIFLCTLNLVFYMIDLTVAGLGVLLASLLFLVKVVCSEIPIMTKNETAMLNILKDNLVYCHTHNEEAPKDLKDAIKFLLYERTSESCIRSLKSDIKKAVPKTIIYKDDSFEANIRRMLSNDLKYATYNSKTTFPNVYISDSGLRQDFIDVCASLSEFKSGFLNFMSLVTDGGFGFNYEVEKVEVRALSEDELSEKVSKYQRSDGQYVYEGTFMPREEITSIIKDTLAVLTIIFKHQVAASEKTVFELRPHSTGPND